MLTLKKVSLILTFIALLSASLMVWAAVTQTLLILDMKNTAELPRNFRTTSDTIKKTSDINVAGFSDLLIAGGAEFSEAALQKILERLNAGHITVIDLRQESHGFIDGNAISWYAPHNAENKDKNPTQVEQSEAKSLAKLAKLKRANVSIIIKKTPDEMIEETQSVLMPVQSVLSEAQLVGKYHLDYKRVYVLDFHAPNAIEVDRFINIIKQLPAGRWIYFHCHAGVGRTSTFMVMYDMMRNAKVVSFDDILARQNAIGGKDLREMPEQGRYKYKPALERLEFLKKFYEYSKNNDDNFQTSWTDWLKQH